MSKFRSSQDFAAVYGSNKQGFGIGIENFIHVKQETTAGTFVPPSIGTQGSSTSAATPSVDISASSNRNGKVAIDGGAVVSFGLASVTGLTTGALIAAALETAINTAASTAGVDGRVWAALVGGVYVFKSQKTGTTSAVVITNGATLDLMTELKLGLPNSGVEAVGTAGGDFLYCTKAGLKTGQPFKESEHKTGRQALNIIKQKKVADGDLECYVNVATGGTPAIDTPLALILEMIFGRKTVIGSSEIKFDMLNPPTKYCSILQGNNVEGRAFNGGYAKSIKFSLPGDGQAKITMPFKAREGKKASIAQILGAVVASANVITQAGQSKRFMIGSHVMVVDTDGRTVLAGADGTLTVASRTDGSDTVVLSAAVTVSTLGFLVPWLPHVFDQTGTDNPQVGLVGSVSMDGGTTTIDQIRSVEISVDPLVEDQDNWYGTDTNQGRIVGAKAKIDVKIDMLLTADQYGQVIDAAEFTAKNVIIKLGDPAARHIELVLPQVKFMQPEIPLPDSGTVIVTFQGMALQSAAGALDAVTLRYL